MKFIGFLVFLIIIYLTNGDYYSSITGLENLLNAEKYLIENLENYVQTMQNKISNMKNFLIYVEYEHEKMNKNSSAYFRDPKNAWRTIRRITQDWRYYKSVAFDQKNESVYERQIQEHENGNEFTKPTNEDLIGAAKGISRLQSTYALDTKDFANGIIMDKKVSTEMASSDCFAVGWSLMLVEDFQNAITWLLEARTRLMKEKQDNQTGGNFDNKQRNGDLIIENLIIAMLKTGNVKFAARLVEEQLENNPLNVKALELSKKIEQIIISKRLNSVLNDFEEAEEKPITLMELYEKTCRGELKQTESEKRELRCRYVTRGEPYCLIAPFKMEEYSLDPYLVVYYDVIYDSEIEYILNAASKKIVRSETGSDDNGIVSDIRISKNTWLNFQVHPFLNNLAWRLTHLTGLDLQTAEDLQVANYGIGGHYGPHYDFSEEENYDFRGTGNRILTALFYINDVEFGGATAFPHLKVAVPPIKRSLVVWHNLHLSLELDYRMKHAGCPVIKGSKWICNEWYHNVGQEFYRPCGLEPDGHKSINYADKYMFP